LELREIKEFRVLPEYRVTMGFSIFQDLRDTRVSPVSTGLSV
jgi:hypothetical protein